VTHVQKKGGGGYEKGIPSLKGHPGVKGGKKRGEKKKKVAGVKKGKRLTGREGKNPHLRGEKTSWNANPKRRGVGKKKKNTLCVMGPKRGGRGGE